MILNLANLQRERERERERERKKGNSKLTHYQPNYKTQEFEDSREGQLTKY